VSSFAHSFSSVFFTHSDKQTSDNFKPNTDTFPSEFFALLGNSMSRWRDRRFMKDVANFNRLFTRHLTTAKSGSSYDSFLINQKDLKDDLGVIGNVLKTEL
jgi:hypothetical protein